MPRKRPEDFKKGINWGKVLNHFRLSRPYWPYWKIIGKRLVYTTLVAGAVWLYDETSPLGWWTLKPRPKEERELAHLYERREFPYPGDKEAMEEFVAKGGMIGTSIGPKGTIENDKDALDIDMAIENQRFEQEANKLWSRMKSEVLSELQEKGFDVE